MTPILISIGANTPDALAAVTSTLEWLCGGADGALYSVIVSKPYTTEELSHRFPGYTNAVARALTDLDIAQLTSLFKSRERLAGRTPQSKTTGLVPLDIDLLTFGDTLLRPRDISRPHVTIGLDYID